MKIKSLFIITVFIINIVILSGCTYSGYYLTVRLIDQPEFYEDRTFNNITSIDLTPYPTLQEALEKFFVPNNNLTVLNRKISSEERENMMNNDLRGYIIYNSKYFSIGFVA